MAVLRQLKPAVPTTLAPAIRVAKRADSFLLSKEWRDLFARLIRTRGRRCEACGRTLDKSGAPVRLFGDHIQEREDGGPLLDPDNVQLLCGSCHSTKTAAARLKRLR